MESREHIEQLAAKWIARRDSGPWTEADAIAFEEWLAQSVAHRAAYYRLNSAWTEAGRVSILGNGSAESGRVELRRRVRTRRSVMGFAIAASVLMLVVAAAVQFVRVLVDERNQRENPSASTWLSSATSAVGANLPVGSYRTAACALSDQTIGRTPRRN